jgi:uncharacterized LabA/DUF88 family protein
MTNVYMYIDGNNLYRSARELGYTLDYKKLHGWLRQKYQVDRVYLFIGLIPKRTSFYEYLQECGLILVFKQTVSCSGVVKGNCDAELVLKAVSDYYTHAFGSCILVTGDGDFGCLVEFLNAQHVLDRVIAPDVKKCSILLKNKNVPITFLNEHYHKFSVQQKEKAPGADASAQGSSS